MRHAQAAAAALAVALALLVGGGMGARLDDADDEGDSAPFMVVVRHAEGRTCGAALVSRRTALSSAACARPAGAGELWAAVPGASGAAGACRVVRVALAAGGDGPAEAVAGDPWAGADGDLALLELAAPLAGSRAILMATDPADCAPPQGCQLVRLVRPAAPCGAGEPAGGGGGGAGDRARGGGGAGRLRIVNATLEEGGACAARGPRWAALRARTLCLTGPELCASDRGTGVVCSGKLCGVVSRSAAAAAGGSGELCGDAHAAAGVPRWRRFLHCAHTRGACGRDGDCAHLCSERWLVDAPPASSPAPPLRAPSASSPAHSRRAPPADALRLTGGAAPAGGAAVAGAARDWTAAPPRIERVTVLRTEPSGAPLPRTKPPPAPPAYPAPVAAASPRGAFEFEPNRADFKALSASARVLLKAGEYGDNAAEYAAPEDAGGAATAASPAPPSRTPPRAERPAAPAVQPAALQPRGAPSEQPAAPQPRGGRPAAAGAGRRSPARVSALVFVLLFMFLLI